MIRPADVRLIADYTMAALRRYIDEGIPPGDFLLAVLSNDLRDAVNRADDQNQHAIVALVSWLYNEAPGNCWGSPDAVNEWLVMHRRRMESGR